MNRPRGKRGSKLRSVYVWHRYLGLSFAAFAILLAVTGWLLNHTEALKLDSRFVQLPLILDWYGITAPRDVAGYCADQHWVSQLNERLYLDVEELPGRYGSLVGALTLRDMIVVAADGQLLLLTPEGELIERLGDAEGVPSGIRAIGVNATGELVIRAVHGDYVTDAEFLVWHRAYADDPTWAAAEPLPPDLYEKLAKHYRGTGLSWERLLLDLHSGRIFGIGGIWIMDIAALLLILLAGTGFWTWLKHKR
jgi:hypothetical protein